MRLILETISGLLILFSGVVVIILGIPIVVAVLFR